MVPVAFRKVTFCKVEEPVTARFVIPAVPETVKAEVEALVAAKFVVVAEVPVAFKKVKFWSEEEAVATRFAVVTVPVAVILAIEIRSPENRAEP